MGFIDAAISRSRTTLMMMSMVVLCGLLARAALPIANDPYIVLPYFLIGIVHEGISPEDGERLLIQPVGNSLAAGRHRDGAFRSQRGYARRARRGAGSSD